MNSEQKIILPNDIKKKDFITFFLITFLIPILMTIPLYLGNKKGLDISAFAGFQMYIPAAAVIIPLLGKKELNGILPKKFLKVYLTALIIGFVSCFLIFIDSKIVNSLQIVFIVLNIVAIFSISLENTEKRKIFNIELKNVSSIVFIMIIFFVLTTIRVFIAMFMSGELKEFLPLIETPQTVVTMISVPFIIFASFLPSFGEEFGWRFYLQPILQKKLGMIRGVLLTGLIWGLWHLPLNIFYYSDGKTWLISLLVQLVFCITIGIFFAYAYSRTKCIWSVVMLHYLNNNWVYVLSSVYSSSTLRNTYHWNSFFITLVGGVIVFGVFFSVNTFGIKTLECLLCMKE